MKYFFSFNKDTFFFNVSKKNFSKIELLCYSKAYKVWKAMENENKKSMGFELRKIHFF